MNRRQLVLTVIGSAIVLCVSVTFLTARLVRFYKENPTSHWVFQELDSRLFSYANRNVSLDDEKDPSGVRWLNIAYGDDKLRLRVAVPHRQHDILVAKGLAAHRDWMRVVRFAEVSGMDADDAVKRMKQGEIRDRLAIVTRTPRAGVEAETWGEAWRKDWTFDFYELRPEGGFIAEKLHYPTTRRGEAPKDGELREGTWQFDAALLTMPKSGVPSQQFLNTGFKAMGWTFPAACLSSVILAVAATMAAYRPKAAFVPA